MIVTEPGAKVNFTDENDVFVGFDMCGMCCETFGWHISHKKVINGLSALLEDGISLEKHDHHEELVGYVFDTSWHETYHAGSDTEVAVFKLINPNGGKYVYIHLYNSHNGYYSHGFDATVGGIEWVHGSL